MPGSSPRIAWAMKALSVLRGLASLATAPGGGEELLDRMLDCVVSGLGCASAAIFLLEPKGNLAVAASTKQWVASANRSPPGDGSPEEQAVNGDQPLAVFAGRILSEGDVPGATGEFRVLAPLRSPDRVLGLLVVCWAQEKRGFLDEIKAFTATAADQVGLAIHHRELLQGNLGKIQQLLALQRISRQMTSAGDLAELLKLVVEEALHLTGAEAGALYLRADGAEDQLVLHAWGGEPPPQGRKRIPLGYGIAGWVGRSGRALRVSDRGAGREEGTYTSRSSQLAVPLLSEARVLGVLAVEGRREEAFTPTHEEILTIFAAQAAKAIEAGRFLRQIREERDLRESILAGTPNGVVALDRNRRVILMNQAARRFLGVTEEPEGNPLERYLMTPSVLEEVERVLAGKSTLESLEVAAPTGGGSRHLLANVFPLGPQRGATLILQDFTDRRRLDDRLQRMSRLASLGQLAAGIAHEIRNPLTGVAISLDVLREEPGLSADGRSLLDDMNREIDRLEALIRGILDFARPQPAQFRPMRLARALDWHRTFREQCRKKDVHFGLELRESPKVEGDPERLMQLFLNLAINALDAVSPGGDVRVWVDRLPGKPRPWARVVVEDTGSGMDEQTLAQVFNPFFTTKNEGTGLGLSIAHSIVEQHGGMIDVQSEPGRGTRFTVDLPALEEG
ncbi:MAG: GAF domain-containing protein [Proteobacteria bacterium]|nr:GAF domain-containing protein [Pseudomonadota bacterium]